MIRPATELTRAFGRVLRETRQKVDLSQEALGLQASVHPTLISQIERGKTIPSLRTIELLAAALEVPPHRLIRAAEKDALRPPLRIAAISMKAPPKRRR